VIAGAQVGPLRYTHIGAYGDVAKIIDPAALAQPRAIADTKTPGILDPQAWFDYDTFSDASPEEPQ
jgi:hypothetical protein